MQKVEAVSASVNKVFFTKRLENTHRKIKNGNENYCVIWDPRYFSFHETIVTKKKCLIFPSNITLEDEKRIVSAALVWIKVFLNRPYNWSDRAEKLNYTCFRDGTYATDDCGQSIADGYKLFLLFGFVIVKAIVPIALTAITLVIVCEVNKYQHSSRNQSSPTAFVTNSFSGLKKIQLFKLSQSFAGSSKNTWTCFKNSSPVSFI